MTPRDGPCTKREPCANGVFPACPRAVSLSVPIRRAPVARRAPPTAKGLAIHGYLAARRQAGTQESARRPQPTRGGVLRPGARHGRSGAAGRLRHQRASRLVAAGIVQRSAHPRDHAGDLRVPAGRGHRWPAVHGQGHARAVRPRAAHRARGPCRQRRRDRDPARRRRDAHARRLARDPRPQSRSSRASRRRRRRHAVAQPARRRRLQVQPARRRPGGHAGDARDRGSCQRAAARRQSRRQARVARRGDARDDDAAGGPGPALCRGPAQRRRHGGDPRGRPEARRRSAGRRRLALLGADQRRLRARHRGRESGDRSDVRVHDGGSRRQDPHGLLEPVRDGASRRTEGPLPRRVRQRSGRGPPRHRHALGRADEPEPLSRGGDPVPADAPRAAGPHRPPSARRWCRAR